MVGVGWERGTNRGLDFGKGRGPGLPTCVCSLLVYATIRTACLPCLVWGRAGAKDACPSLTYPIRHTLSGASATWCWCTSG